MRILHRLLICFWAALALTLPAAAGAAGPTFVEGLGHNLWMRLALDEEEVPIRWEIEWGWTRCQNSWAPLPENKKFQIPNATTEAFEFRDRYSYRQGGFRVEAKIHVTGRHLEGTSWEGRYTTKMIQYYKGSRVNTCVRNGAEAVWKAGPGFKHPEIDPATR
jgi:hypothetical protein